MRRRPPLEAGSASIVALVLLLLDPSLSAAQSLVSTTTTTYSYNLDGALVEVAVTVSGSPGESPSGTTGLTWDNYDSATQQVKAGNGNLARVDAPEGSQIYAFDARDRLIEFQATGRTTRYDYDPGSMMAMSTFEENESYRFYYDQHNANAVNIVQQDLGGETLSSARSLGARYLSDGSEQMLVQHRKDVGGLYSPDEQSFAKYQYDPYGSSQAVPSVSSGYDLHENPYQYTGQYQDPSSGLYYLRARYYDPSLPVFLSRDPEATTSRYGYGAGNPISNVDPSGRRPEPYLAKLAHKGPWGSFVAGILSGITFGVMPLIETGRAEGARQFFAGPESWRNYLTMVMTAGAVSILAPVTPWIGLGQTELQIATHPRHWQRYLAGLAGGYLGGAVSGTVYGGGGFLIGYTRSTLSTVPDTRLDFTLDKETFLKYARQVNGDSEDPSAPEALEEGEVDVYIVRRKLNRANAATEYRGYEIAHYQIVLVSRNDIALIGLTTRSVEQEFGVRGLPASFDAVLGRALGDNSLSDRVVPTFRLAGDQEWPDGAVARREGRIPASRTGPDRLSPAANVANRVATDAYQRDVVGLDPSARNRRNQFKWYSVLRGQQCQSWANIVQAELLNPE